MDAGTMNAARNYGAMVSVGTRDECICISTGCLGPSALHSVAPSILSPLASRTNLIKSPHLTLKALNQALCLLDQALTPEARMLLARGEIGDQNCVHPCRQERVGIAMEGGELRPEAKVETRRRIQR